MCEKRGVSESMGRSWNETKGSFWPLFGLTLLGAAPVVLAVATVGILFGNAEPTSVTGIVMSIITNLCLTAMSAYYAVLGLATYRRLFRQHRLL